MENILMSLIMAGVFIFGFYIVDLLGRSVDESRRGGDRRPSGERKSSRSSDPERFFR